jgi:hypothetical protein
MMGRDTHHEERRLRSPWWWVEHSYPMGPMMGRENALFMSAVYGVFVGWVEVCGDSCFVVHAKEGRTKTSVVLEINTSTYAAQT